MANIDQADAYRKLQELYADMSDGKLEDMAENIDDLTEIAQQVLRAEISKRGLDEQGELAPTDRGPVFDVTRSEAARRNRNLQGHDSTASRKGSVKESAGDDALAGGDRDPDGPAPEDPGEEDGSQPPLDLWGMGAKDPFTQGTDPTAYHLVRIWYADDAEQARAIMGIFDANNIKSFLGPDNVESVDDYKGSYEGGVEIKVMKFQANYAQTGLRASLPSQPQEESAEQEEFAICCPKCNSPEVVLLGLVEEPGKRSEHAAKNSWSCDACGHHWEDEGIVENA